MRYWMDCEFIEDGHTIELISIGIVAEDGREYYAQSGEFDRRNASDWVKENVLSHLVLCPWAKAAAIDSRHPYINDIHHHKRSGQCVDQQRGRSEEHTSELQSPDHLVCRLLLEKKKKIKDRSGDARASTH